MPAPADHVESGQRARLDPHAQFQQELEVTERIYANVLNRGVLKSEDFRYISSAVAVLNGDLLLAEATPDGALRVLVGDFTGHGLVAAVGALPVADVFFGMTCKGFSLAETLAEINAKTRRLLPTGRFLAAAMFELDADRSHLSAWNGGLPDVLIYRAAERAIGARVISGSLPLGIVDNSVFEPSIERIGVAPEDRILACSDGVLEAPDATGQMFGEARLEAAVNLGTANSDPFADVVAAIGVHTVGTSQSDDLTLVELRVGEPAVYGDAEVSESSPRATRAACHWSFSLTLQSDCLDGADPLPLLVQFIQEQQGLAEHREPIFVILAELYTNALEHGLLALDSRLKDGPAGFERYFEERTQRLEALQAGRIDVEIWNVPVPHGQGGRLHIRIRDTGAGFDHRNLVQPSAGDLWHHGRGLGLVRGLCESLTHNEDGNEAVAIYYWS